MNVVVNYKLGVIKKYTCDICWMSFGTSGSNTFLNEVLIKNENNYGSGNFSLFI
jgi:hypothetical protein